MLDRFFADSALHAGAHVGYFSGLSMLLPILADAWEKSVKPWVVSPNGFWIAFGLVFLSIMLLGWLAGSINKLLRGLGWTMLIPGVLAILFASFGQANVYNFAEQNIAGFATYEPVVDWVVEHAVPKVAYIGGVYVLVGVVLIWIGRKLRSISYFV